MKEFDCGALVPGCTWRARHETEAEVMRAAAQHLREIHGEMMMREHTVDAIRSRIETLWEEEV